MAGQTLKPACGSKEPASFRSYPTPRFSQCKKFGKIRFVASHESKSRCKFSKETLFGVLRLKVRSFSKLKANLNHTVLNLNTQRSQPRSEATQRLDSANCKNFGKLRFVASHESKSRCKCSKETLFSCILGN